MPGWILRDHQPVWVSDAEYYAFSGDFKNMHVAETHLGTRRVSTVFLGIDHNFGGSDPPILFETMIFEGDSYSDLYCDRYATWEQAVAGHAKAVGMLGGTFEMSQPEEALPTPTAWDHLLRDEAL